MKTEIIISNYAQILDHAFDAWAKFVYLLYPSRDLPQHIFVSGLWGGEIFKRYYLGQPVVENVTLESVMGRYSCYARLCSLCKHPEHISSAQLEPWCAGAVRAGRGSPNIFSCAGMADKLENEAIATISLYKMGLISLAYVADVATVSNNRYLSTPMFQELVSEAADQEIKKITKRISPAYTAAMCG